MSKPILEWHDWLYDGPFEPGYIHLRYNPGGWTERRKPEGAWERIDLSVLAQPRVVERHSPFVPLRTKSGRRMLVRASAVEFAIENALDNNLRPSVHIVLAGGEQGDAEVTWDEFVGALEHAEDSHPGQERGDA